VRVHAPEPGEVHVPSDVFAGFDQSVHHVVEVGDQNPGMTFAGRSKIVFDSEVPFDAASADHAPPRAARTGGLSTSIMPSTPTKKSRAACSSSRGIANCMWWSRSKVTKLSCLKTPASRRLRR